MKIEVLRYDMLWWVVCTDIMGKFTAFSFIFYQSLL